MARLASQEKMGYYKTPVEVVEQIKDSLDFAQGARIFDPCCGTGEAIQILAAGEDAVETYGVELEKSRYQNAKKVLTCVHWADAITELKVTAKMADLLFLNPPYDDGGIDGNRMEYTFLQAFKKTLVPNGVLVFIIPHTTIRKENVRNILANYYGNLEFYRFPDDLFKQFRQIVIIGRKKRLKPEKIQENHDRLKKISNSSWDARIKFELPTTEKITDSFNKRRLSIPCKAAKVFTFQAQHIDPEEILPLIQTSQDEFFKLVGIPNFKCIKPLLPPKQGHLAMLLAAGLINGELKESGFDLVVKGTVEEVTEQLDQSTETEKVTVFRSKSVVTLKVLDMSTGEITVLN